MAQRIFTLIFLLWTAVGTPNVAASSFGQKLFGNSTTSRFLPVDGAFAFEFQQQGNQLNLRWDIHPDYYLYRAQIKIEGNDATLGKVELPQGESHNDEFFGQVFILRDRLELAVPIEQAESGATVKVTYQGCADAGFCYPPETRIVPLSQVLATTSSDAPLNTLSDKARPLDQTVPPQTTPMPFSPWWALLIGIGVAFTPCVLPMYPLIASLVLGRKEQLTPRRTLLLSMTYVQGMALTYTLLGLVVAAAGLRFQAALQHPAILIGLSVMFAALALSMFGLYTLQLPSSVQTRLTEWSNRQQGGSVTGVFCMGALAGLICSPCTTAPLSAILLYIAQSGNMLAGGGTLYLYALGMGLPLILVTLFGNKLLPRSGPWMQYVKEAFGFIILALPVFLLERILGETWGMRLWSALGIAFFGWALMLTLRSSKGWIRGVQLLLLAGVVISAKPLQDWIFPPAGVAQTHTSALNFAPVANIADLNSALAKSPQPVMLDLYADWCVACKEFEKYTFSDPAVQNHLSRITLLQADVTANREEQNALLKKLQVLGLPTIVFFDAQGKEIPGSRVTGFMNAEQFQAHLRKFSP
ncbi:protein-disulfide reductase DsbD [Pectobacterium parmentieri]|uniref:protein-disulfide reductase DsbD n=1 Tax=Pectobacterium parmentieri TaxID=1905730 RepID=UPI000CDD4EEF|nr:protein-disulfide reductase DsbD [Pectobacterium parmentieri]AYH04502.1 protein-disulfide reductase DsbD [Pectobacterium parmentieri]AYH13325.1 protein-disulfide reductase DsbD [Pectobacterium parmentieri]AYH22027.1 protein-disulfide reductase DsbD [Pectobacterium parmentieri]MBN3179204.1 protein-disulfide reductase DsbD [Pectobacterium parmentieri]POW29384.1 protein-disulfide reductase DsbD [Pectobacterium parmentieri]